MSKNSLLAVLFGSLLTIGLAGCTDEKTIKSDDEKIDTTEVIEDDEKQATNEVESGTSDDVTIGITMDDFKKDFNKNASKHKLDSKVEEFEWSEPKGGHVMTAIEFDENSGMTALSQASDKELKAIFFESKDYNSREMVMNLVETVIESSNKKLSDSELKVIVEKLKLGELNEDGFMIQTEAHYDGNKYFYYDDGFSSYELLVANENDEAFTTE